MNGTSTLRVLMLVENVYPADRRVAQEAQTLVAAGYQVTVIALREPGQAFAEQLDGVRVFRIPTITVFKKLGNRRNALLRIVGVLQAVLGYFVEYVYFTAACVALSAYVALRWGLDVVHAHNPPDTLWVLGALYRPFGIDFVFDHHDLSPELYLSRFGLDVAEGGVLYKILMWLEKMSLRLSTVSIATNDSYKAIHIARGRRRPERVFVVRNGPDLNRVRLVAQDERLKTMNKCILGYVGAMNPQDGLDYMLRALHILLHKFQRTDFFCVAVGSGDSFESLKTLSHELGLDDYVSFTGHVADEELMRYLSTADICLDPNPSSPLNDVSTWIKVMEYMALGKPIVAFDLKETRYSSAAAAVYAPPNDEEAFAAAICALMDDPNRRREMGDTGKRRIATELRWDLVSAELLRGYQAILTVRDSRKVGFRRSGSDRNAVRDR